LTSIKALDDYTVQMTVAAAGAGVWEMILGFCPVVSQSWYENSSDADKSNNPACTGAYYVAENSPGTSVKLVADDNYWQKPELRSTVRAQNVKTINCVVITEDGMRTIALQNGEIDAGKIQVADVDKFLNDPNYHINRVGQANATNLLFNCVSGGVLDNENLRKAILYAVDFNQVTIAANGSPDFGIRIHDAGNALASDYNKAWDSQPYFDYNVDTAKQFLSDAGYSASNAPSLKLMVKNLPFQIAGATVIQSYLSAIGINVDILTYDTAAYNSNLTQTDQWDMVWVASTSNSGLVLDAWNFLYGVVDSNGTLGHVNGDTQMQDLLSAAIQKHDEASLDAFHNYLIDKAYGVGIFVEEVTFISQGGITNISGQFNSNAALGAASFASGYATTVK